MRKIIGVVAGATGFFAATLALYQWYQTPPPINELLFVQKEATSGPYIVDSNLDVRSLVEDEIVISGQITVPDEFVLVANYLKFERDSAIIAPAAGKVLIIATEIHQGLAAANGVDGDTPETSGAPGGKGGDGGMITIVAGLVNGFAIQAAGGRGGDGASGTNGANGRDGRCDGFGRWRKANPGGNGQDGGDAGNGGDGGIVTIYAPDDLRIEPVVHGGAPGNPGQGGIGGTGGRGCTGLGGSQASRAAGANGSPGKESRPGKDGIVHRPNVPFQDMAQRLHLAIVSDTVSYPTILAVVEGLRGNGDDQ